MTVTKSRRKRGGGRAGNAGRRGGSSILQLPWHLTKNIDMPTEPLNEEGVTAIHLGAMEILEEIGLEILNQEARDILKKAGCLVSGENVKFDREFIMGGVCPDICARVFKVFGRVERDLDLGCDGRGNGHRKSKACGAKVVDE